MKSPVHILVTGAAGFIGGRFCQLALNRKFKITGIDNFSFASSKKTIEVLNSDPNFQFCQADICSKNFTEKLKNKINGSKFSAVFHFAAETHVDRSIREPETFYWTNVIGTQRLINSLQNSDLCNDDFRFVHISTDEVFGTIDIDEFFEQSPYRPNSPYSASKASSDHIVRAANKTYNFPAIITNCTNNFGPAQFPEKLIPSTIIRAIQGKKIFVYGDGLQVRDWLFVDDHCEALLMVLDKGKIGETYNIGAENRMKNVEVIKIVCSILDELKPLKNNQSYQKQILHVEDRPGHDRRYAVNAEKIKREILWKPETNFIDGLKLTVNWYINNQNWWQK